MSKQSRIKNNADSVLREFALFKCGTPDRSRTCDLQNRNLTLYPTELRVRKCGKCGTAAEALLF